MLTFTDCTTLTRVLTVPPQGSQTAQQPRMTRGEASSDGKRPLGFKWCYAHVAIAKQIHQHQQQTKVRLSIGSGSAIQSFGVAWAAPLFL